MSVPHTLTVIDETVSGEVVNELSLSFLMGKISAKDIIAERVRVEVEQYNNKVNELRFGLVQPTFVENALNQKIKERKTKPKVDAKKQIDVALEAFKNNGFFLLVGDQQVEDIDALIDLEVYPTISFIKLTPLVGG